MFTFKDSLRRRNLKPLKGEAKPFRCNWGVTVESKYCTIESNGKGGVFTDNSADKIRFSNTHEENNFISNAKGR